MLDIAADLHEWCEQGRDFAVATVVAVHGSAPRQPGAALAVDAGGEAVGSVSGGCVEGAVYELCQEALTAGRPVLETFGYSDEDAFAVGLTCGGELKVLVVPVRRDAPWRATVAAALASAASGESAALARVVAGPAEQLGQALHVRADGSAHGTLGAGPTLDRAAAAQARALLDTGRTGLVDLATDGSLRPRGVGEYAAVQDAPPEPEGEAPGTGPSTGDAAAETCGSVVTLLVETCAPAPRMLVFGAIDFAAALVRAGTFLGYRVTVCDARPVFATAARFPEAAEVVVEWPHRYLERTETDGRTVVCVLTHDTKFDVPLLERALRLPLGYVGAMGSRRTHLDRLARLRETGLGEAELARLHSPLGLDLGARTPEETALSIAAEIVAARRGGSGRPLTGAHTPIHRS
jgi:xanthine dehydrogenase accessory factor